MEVGELSFEETINQLHQQIGRHPTFKDQWGRDMDGGDSENDLSDETMERLCRQDEEERVAGIKKRNEARRKRQGGGVDREGKKGKSKGGKDSDDRKDRKKRRLEDPRPFFAYVSQFF